MKVNNNDMMQKTVCITYDNMEDLMNRRDAITNTLQGYLNRNDNYQYISDTVVSIGEDDKYRLVFTLDVTNKD